MKKVFALILMFALLLPVFAGCSTTGSVDLNDDENKEVTLVIAFARAEQKDAAEVQEVINQKLEELLPNTKIQLLLDASMADKWPLWMSTKKEIDIAHSGYHTDIEQEVLNRTYLELDELVDAYAPSIKALREEYWYSYDNASVNGNLYAVPNIQYHTKETLTLRINKAMVEYFDTKALTDETYASVKTPARFWELLTAGVTAAKAAGVNVDCCLNPKELLSVAQRGYIFIGGENSNLCYAIDDPECRIIDFYDTAEFADFCRYTKQWAEQGFISPDVLTNQDFGKVSAYRGCRFGLDEETREIVPTGGATGTYLTYNLDDPAKDVAVTNVGENMTYYSIPFTSKNPARAIKFLNLINSEAGKEIVNLLAYGIEGKHWEYVDEEKGDIKAYEYLGQASANNSYGIPNWECANMMLIHNVAPYTHENQEYGRKYYLEHLNSIEKHALYGLTFDTTAHTDNLARVLKNNKEYGESIYCGIVKNADNLMKELRDKNASAGIQQIIEDLQKQADAYRAK